MTMKQTSMLLFAAALMFSSCGIAAYQASSSDGQRFQDGIYSNTPSFRSKTEKEESQAEVKALAQKTKESEIYLFGDKKDTVMIPENFYATIRFDQKVGGTSITVGEYPYITDYGYYYGPYSIGSSFYWSRHYDPYYSTFYNPYWNSYSYNFWRYHHYYDPWYYSPWHYSGFYDPWYYGSHWSCYDPWYHHHHHHGWYDPWYGHHHYHGWNPPPHHNKPGHNKPGNSKPGSGHDRWYGPRVATTGSPSSTGSVSTSGV